METGARGRSEASVWRCPDGEFGPKELELGDCKGMNCLLFMVGVGKHWNHFCASCGLVVEIQPLSC